MRKTALSALFCTICAVCSSQNIQNAAEEAAKALSEAPKAAAAAKVKPSFWTRSIQVDLGFNQTGLTNWAAGGYNTFTLSSGIDAKANYAKDLMSWNNRLQLQYGFLWSKDKDDLLQKNTDRIYLESKWAYKTGKDSKWNYTASFNFRSQFSNGYTYNTPGEGQSWLEAATLKSGFMAPAYTDVALGMEWKPAKWFDINIAPLTGGFTICNVEALRKTYGMKLLDESVPEKGYSSALFQFGAQVKMNLKTTINDVFKYETQMVIFTDYLNHPFDHNRVNWDNKVTWQLNKLFRLGFDTWLIYDPNVLIDNVQKVQFKEFFSFNFTYTIASRKK